MDTEDEKTGRAQRSSYKLRRPMIVRLAYCYGSLWEVVPPDREGQTHWGTNTLTGDPLLKNRCAQRARPRLRGTQHAVTPSTSARYSRNLAQSLGALVRTASSSTGMSRPRWSRLLRLSILRNGSRWRWLPRPDTPTSRISRRVWSLPRSQRRPTRPRTHLLPWLRARTQSSPMPSRALLNHLLLSPLLLHPRSWQLLLAENRVAPTRPQRRLRDRTGPQRQPAACDHINVARRPSN